MTKTTAHLLYSSFLAASSVFAAPTRAQAQTQAPAAPTTAEQPTADSSASPPAPVEAMPAAPLRPAVPAVMPPTSPPLVVAAPAKPVERPATGVSSKFAAELYGFVEFDAIHDSTQSFNDQAANGGITSDSYASTHQRTIFGARNSRIGFKLKGPGSEDIKSSAILEMDFLGNQPTTASEAAFITSPTFRIRHFALKLETPIVDVLFGQYWSLFGWQSNYHPNTVEIQGVPGEVYSRSPQIRLSHMFKSEDVSVELAVAAVRPAQKDSSMPDGHAGLRLLVNGWKGLHTAGSTGTAIDALSIGVSGIYRHFQVPEFASPVTGSRKADGSGFSVDALIPVIPATPENRGNSLTLTGSFVKGTGIADLYSGLTGGLTLPTALPNPNNLSPAPTYSPDVDNGLVAFDTASGDLKTINWLSYMAGIQYYLPPSGRVWVSANLSGMKSNNIGQYGTASKLFDRTVWADGNLFVDINQAVRLGAEFAWFRQTYADDSNRHNYRTQFSAFYIF